MAKKIKSETTKVKGKLINQAPDEPPRDYSLIKAIREEKAYKSNITARDTAVRKWVKENLKPKGNGTIMPGQLIMFNYFEPATKEELEYYDAMPCTIFFNEFKTQNGEMRVLGFNIHYYPPRMRYIIADRVFSIFKPLYEKSWNIPLKTPMSYMQYKMLLEQLKNQGLDFGVREYIPALMHDIVPIPPKDWSKAVFTEGRFKKRTREQILNYWRTWIDKHSK